MDPCFEDLRGDPALKDGAAKGMLAELFRAPNPQEEAGETRIQKVELRSLHQALSHVRMEGSHSVGYEAGFQNGNPGLGRHVGDPAIGPQ